MHDADEILQRLRERPDHLDALVTLAVDDLLARPLREVLDPAWVASTAVEGLRASASDERTEAWIRARIDEARARAGQEHGRAGDLLTPDLVEAVKELLRRPYVPDRELVGRFVHHRAVHELVRDMLEHALVEFGQKTRAVVPQQLPKSLGRSRFGKLVSAATDVAGAVGSEVERQLEKRVKVFVDGAIRASVDRMADHLVAVERAKDLGDWRADGFQVLLDLSVDDWLAELDKLDPDGLVTDLATLLRAVARMERLEDQLRSLLASAVEEAGDVSAGEFLAGSGLEESWRPPLESLARERVKAFVATPAFAGWVADLVR